LKNFIAIGLACCIPVVLSAEEADHHQAFPDVAVLVVDESAPASVERLCPRAPGEGPDAQCFSIDRAVLTARIQRGSLFHERGRWM
jgi:hypothetical protein